MQFISYTHWQQLPDNANTLFAQYEKDSLFFSRLWFENLVKTALKNEQSLLLPCVIEDENVLAILPLIQNKGENWYSLSTQYAARYTLLLADNAPTDTLNCLVQGLQQLPFRYLSINPIAEDDKNINALQNVMEKSGFHCHRTFRFFNWYYPVQGQAFKDYMASRSGVVRNNIARKQRKLQREHGYTIQLFIDEDLQQAVTDYHQVYQASWKANEFFTDFTQGVVESLAKPKWLRFAILYIAEQPVAAQIWFVAHGKANIFRLVYDENWKRYSTGSILTQYLMEYVIDTDKVEEIDFLMGNDAYKKDWMSERRLRWVLDCMVIREPKTKLARLKALWQLIIRHIS